MKNLGKRILSTILMLAMAISVLPGISVSASGDYMIFSAEFDGNDDITYWSKFGNNGVKVDGGSAAGNVAKGVLTTIPSTTGFGYWGVYWGENNAINTADKDGNYKENLYLEMKFKIGGTVSNTQIWGLNGTRIDASSSEDFNFVRVEISGGKLAGGSDAGKTVSDYTFSADTWYTLKSRVNFKDKNVYTQITDENGNSGELTCNFYYSKAIKNIMSLRLHKNIDVNTTFITDYVRLYDADLLPPVTVLYNESDLSNQRISSNSFTANVTFPFDVTQADLNGITINNGASVSAVIGNDDNKSATLSISSLADRVAYTLSIPAIGTNPAKEVKFIAANDSGYLFRAEFDGIDDTTLWNVYAANGTKIDKDFDSLIDTDTEKITMTAGNVSFGRMKIEFPNAIDVTGKDNVIWETKLSFKNAITVNNRFMGINDKFKGHVEIGVKDSKFYYGGIEGNAQSTDTEVVMEAGKEYILSVSIDFVKNEYALTIKDEENGIIFKGNKVSFSYGNDTDQIDYIDLPSLSDGNTVTMDYVRLYEEQEKTPVFSDPISPVANVETFNGATNTYSKAFNIEGLDWSLYKSIIVKSGDEVKGKSFTALNINNDISGEGSVGIIVNGLPQSNVAIRFTDKEIK